MHYHTNDNAGTDGGQIARDGTYFIKRDRNKEGTLGIYTVKPVTSKSGKTSNQTVRVASTNTSDPEVAEIALKRFVLNDREAKQKERERLASGKEASQAIDRPILEVLNMYYLGHAEKKGGGIANTVKNTMRDVQGAWPDNPMCSTLDRDKQKDFVRYMRDQGYTDNTIGTRFSYLWSAMNWVDAGGKLGKFPGRITNAEWEANLTSTKEGPYELEELAALFVQARENPAHWRYLVCAVGTASRPTALIELRYPQFKFRHGLCQLNPDGRRQTKKRRATVRMCPTFIAEAASWSRDSEFVIGLDSTSFFEGLTAKAGVTGSPMRIRKTVRSWLAEKGVLDPMADVLMGHAEEGSETGRRWYKFVKPDYQKPCAAAIEELFIEIARRSGILFAGMTKLPSRPFTLQEVAHAWRFGAANEANWHVDVAST